MRRPGGRYVVLVLCASLLVGGASIWRWMNRPAIKLRCPGGARPEALVLGSTIGIGHGVIASAVRVDGEKLTTRYLSDAPAEREVNAAGRDELFHRLEHPGELPADAGDAEVTVLVAYDCAGAFREEELTVSFRPAPTLDRLIRDPVAALRSLDPRSRTVFVAAMEIMEIAMGE